ncbi:flagellar hook protein FlgE [Scopulibacillus darangshiensis]|uniref:Flagellar hook protein FlgE n=1 Tax=Scopulibacillus darangshiensis TaxID=442528 RepID=A0A4R2P7X9_9BACL|nr:flagellar basal body rod protein FlgG [Scopulibacillus darangshiensis]TCP30324.1 flagellar hook protein FlgE [Scopulibacillus darangshiensis]
MLRSMYSAISGMKNFQTKLDVIGNNIANVNTYGFKKGRVTFKDMVSQEITGATGPQGGRGGINQQQVGLGSTLASIDNVDTQGSIQTTGRQLDLAISGDGYFVVSDGKTKYYTRAGNFYLDKDGSLVNANGLKVLNTNGDAIQINKKQGNGLTLKTFSIGASGEITGTLSDGTIKSLGQLKQVTFDNTGGLQKAGSSLYINTANSGAPIPSMPGEGGGEIVAGALEMSNVDLSEEFTSMIEAQRGFQANARVITTSDQILQELVNLKR